MEKLTDPYAIAKFIKDAEKVTPVKLYLKGQLETVDFSGLKVFGEGNSRIIFGDVTLITQRSCLSSFSRQFLPRC